MSDVLFYKLLAHDNLFKEIQYIKNKTYWLGLNIFIENNKYNPLQKIKELENDINSEILNEKILKFIEEYKEKDEITRVNALLEMLNAEFENADNYLIKHIGQYFNRVF